MNIIDELKSREILKDITNIDKFNSLEGNEGVYIGFDPTADSLHLGNYIQVATLLRFKEAGFKAVAVLGGATGMIGDPSGKSSERNLLSVEDLNANKQAIRNQLESFGLEVIDNYDFYKDVNVLEFLRDAGKLLNITYMMNKEIVSSRIGEDKDGMSFTEFAYQLIQGWDFKELYDKHNVSIQVGGSDQWGNITAGVEIIRKVLGDKNKAVGITTNLLTTSDGKKFGKSEGGALFLDKDRTSSYAIYQYLLNASDQDVSTYLRWLTFISLDEITSILEDHSNEPFKRKAQKRLAHEVIKQLHGEEAANSAKQLSESLFSGDVSNLSAEQVLQLEGAVTTIELSESSLVDALVNTGAAKSNRNAREFIENGAVAVNGEIVTDVEFSIKPNSYDGKATLIRRGKKNYFLIKH